MYLIVSITINILNYNNQFKLIHVSYISRRRIYQVTVNCYIFIFGILIITKIFYKIKYPMRLIIYYCFRFPSDLKNILFINICKNQLNK